MNEIKTTEESIGKNKSMRKSSTQNYKGLSFNEDAEEIAHNSQYEKFKSIGEFKMKVDFKHRK